MIFATEFAGKVMAKRATKTFLFLLVCSMVMTVFLPEARALSRPHSCTREHLTRAIELNTARRGAYAALTQNQSLAISDAMVQMEHELLRQAPLADLGSFLYQMAGVPLLCAEYVSMDLVPAFQTRSTAPWPVLASYRPLDSAELTRSLQEANEKKDFTEVLKIAEDWLTVLDTQKGFHCLTRHFVESIARAAALAPEQNALARRKLGLSSLGISKKFIEIHLKLFTRAQQIDAAAAPLQAAGVPIICQDVPPIALPE